MGEEEEEEFKAFMFTLGDVRLGGNRRVLHRRDDEDDDLDPNQHCKWIIRLQDEPRLWKERERKGVSEQMIINWQLSEVQVLDPALSEVDTLVWR